MNRETEPQTAQASAAEARREMDQLELDRRMRDIGRKILVLSGKGGVGKSTVAVNLAVALAKADQGQTVGLLDVDIHGPSIPKLMGLEGRPVQANGQFLLPVEADDRLKVMSIGLLLERQSDAVIWRGPRKFGVIRQFLKDVEWGRLDYLVVDSPPGTGDEPLAVAQMVGQPAGAVLVTTPQDLAVADVRRCVEFCRALSLPVIGIIENMSGYVCPECGRRVDLFKSGGGEALAEEVGVRFLARVPIDPNVVASGDSGKPFAAGAGDGPAAKAFAQAVSAILESTRPAVRPGGAEVDKENPQMKIAIPLADGRLTLHFGHCQAFALLEVDVQDKRITKQAVLQPPSHEPGALPEWLREQGVEIVIAGGMGERAQQILADAGIRVVVGVEAEEPAALVEAFLNDTLQAGENICDH